MNDLNKWIGIGRLTRDPEVKQTTTGKDVASFSLAINDGWGDKKSVSFIDCEAWGKTAEIMGKYCSKGKQIAVTGRLKQDSWEKDGQKRSKIKIVVESMQLLGGTGDSEQGMGTVVESAPPMTDDNPFSDADIPF